MSVPPHLVYTCWASADEWRHGFVMLGANVYSIPAPPPQSDPVVCVDGFWGAHEWMVYPQLYRREFPYLAWIPLRRRSLSRSVPSDVLTRPVEKMMWRAHPLRSDCHLVNPELFEELTIKWQSIKEALKHPFDLVSSQPSFSSIVRPMKAYTRAFEALNKLEKDFRAWRDFVEVLRNLQRSLLELSAFLDWWKDVCAGDSFQSPIRTPTRGAVFRDERLYADHARWSVASYLLIPKPAFALDPAKKVPLSPHESCSTRPMTLQPLVHSLHHWYYPPLVDDVAANLETAARGYHERLDTFRPTKELKRTLDKMENKKNDEGKHMLDFSLNHTNVSCTAGRMAKKARMDAASHLSQSNHPELRRLTDAGAAPAWFPETQEVWMVAVGHVSHLKLAPSTSPRRFSLPPIKLFWGSNEENQRIFYYHFLLLRGALLERRTSDLPPLTTGEWKTILGNTYWKTQWPKQDDSPTTFDPNVFWKHGGPLFFGDIRSADVAAGRHDPTRLLPCHCVVQMSTADDPDVRQVILYYLNSFHIYEEIKAMERIQLKDTFEKRWIHKECWVYHIAEMWDPVGGTSESRFFCNKKAWRIWLFSVREVVMDWDGFDSWDWDGISNVRTLNVDSLLGPVFRRLTVRLLAFYIHSFVSHLGYYPSSLLHPPVLAVPSCREHSRKFGLGYTIFVMV